MGRVTCDTAEAATHSTKLVPGPLGGWVVGCLGGWGCDLRHSRGLDTLDKVPATMTGRLVYGALAGTMETYSCLMGPMVCDRPE
jgi:hypothetical protein